MNIKTPTKTTRLIPPEKSSVTHHELAIGGKSLKYTATAGTLLIRDVEDKPYGSMFYVAYTLDGAELGTRPVSFLYNGGPGSATIWLHMGSFSPVRVSTDSPNATSGPPFKLVPNQYSLLDKTDLVFVDAPLTGLSRAVGKGQPKDLIGTDPDLRAFDRFIQRYLTVNQRWNSPKFLIGESYGTTRSAALADMLGNDGVQLDGVVLISSILNYSIRAPDTTSSTSPICPATPQPPGTSIRFPTSPPTWATGWSRRASSPPDPMPLRSLPVTPCPPRNSMTSPSR